MPDIDGEWAAGRGSAGASPPNLINVDDVAAFAEGLARRVRRPEGRQWFCRNLRNFLLREHRLCRTAKPEEVLALASGDRAVALPGWVRPALADGRLLHWFTPHDNETWEGGADFVQTLQTVRDWMNALPDDDRHWRQLPKMAVPDAVAAARLWHRQLERRGADAWPEDWSALSTVKGFDDGQKIVRLSSAEALRREGTLMRLCVEGYAREVAAGICEIYSLRDTGNYPHVTMEIVAGVVQQVQGKANSVPGAKWRAYVAELIRAMGWSLGWDGFRFGVFTYAGRIYADVEEVIADLPRLLPADELAFDWRKLLPFFRFIRGRHQDGRVALAVEHQRALFEMLRDSIIAHGGYRLRRAAAIAVELPGSPIAELRIEITGAALALAEIGILATMRQEIRALYREIGRRVFATIDRHPEALYLLSLGEGCMSTDNAIGSFFASVGLAENFQRVRRAALERKRQRVTDAIVALRHRLADRRTLDRITLEDRAKAMNLIRVQAPRFFEQTLRDPQVA